MTSRQEGKTPISSVHPSLVGRLDLPLEDLSPEDVGRRAQCVFGCLPHCASAEILPRVVAAGAKVVDFSADYRLDDAATYLEWYGHEHPDAPRLGQTVYGLPELFRDRIRGQSLVANPGCYSTSAILPSRGGPRPTPSPAMAGSHGRARCGITTPWPGSPSRGS